MKVKFYTLGCKVNQYESQAISEALIRKGFEITSDKNADVIIVNSCTVTASADQKTRQAVHRFRRNNPDSVIVLTGCMPQAYPEKSEELTDADIILGNKNNDTLPDLLCEFIKSRDRILSVCEHKKGDPFRGDTISGFDERTRASVKIQDGCNRFCSYCVIPYSRGRVRSKPLDILKKEVETLAKKGYSEVVLVGINLSSYGQDINESFPAAVKTACDVEGIERVRLGSLEPDHLTDEVIEKLSSCEKLCPQFHLSLQSGCDRTLRSMNRHYTSDDFRKIALKLRSTFNDCTLTTDVMVGFAGESEEDFSESLAFVKEIGFEKVHVFPYSVRKGTKAEKLPGHLEKSVKEKRCKIMIEETEKLRREFFRRQKGRIYTVIPEVTGKDGLTTGYTPNYIPVKFEMSDRHPRECIRVEITGTGDGDFCTGKIID
ncbi:MAG: tRNA (N(6)-L-threonylcarbamoyladenosine(37)-C(2))-methylthiotransferase MtaB [Clostridia bacterium]|nr:tRNA (N(6)-L-threonylcarbamoyladenosine(37)-C(2))-methylthiotransferase MtaB [Oscillospiraceae bacterium]MBQ7005029.1 tRNA (N(6)-L-threonylcarbamoyladenosine(37)-C(2))-methylthiotransferase MtaB [Clostridia bacterium]